MTTSATSPTGRTPPLGQDGISSDGASGGDKRSTFLRALTEQQHREGPEAAQTNGQLTDERPDVMEVVTFPFRVLYDRGPSTGSRLLKWVSHVLIGGAQDPIDFPAVPSADPDEESTKKRLMSFLGWTEEDLEKWWAEETSIPSSGSLESRLKNFLGLTDRELEERLAKLEKGFDPADEQSEGAAASVAFFPPELDLPASSRTTPRAEMPGDDMRLRFEKLRFGRLRGGSPPAGEASSEAEPSSPQWADPDVERSGERVAHRQAYESNGRAVDGQP